MTSPTLTPQELKAQLDAPNIILLDCSIPKVTGGTSKFEGRTIPGAIVVNLKEDFSNVNGEFPNTVPTTEQFETTCNKLGVTNDSKVIVFDNLGVYSSPRVWWLFKTMGHENVQVLDGGLPTWEEAGYPIEEKDLSTLVEVTTGKKPYVANFEPEHVVLYQNVVENTKACQFTIIDARSKGRFDGTSPEPRASLQSGNIPNSVNLPYQEVLDGHRFKSSSELKVIFESLKTDNEIVYSCGSGLTACIILLAGHLAGVNGLKVYDGSWTEWATLQKLTT